jgi:DNA-binding response OmpR family regulator
MKVLIVDDDAEVVDAVGVALQFHWPDVLVLSATGADQGAELFYQHDPDLVLLDVSMPGRNGFELLREIRRVSDAPVLMLTGRADETDVVRGLDLGADDYLTKPFSHLELLARIKAVTRRTRLAAPGRAAPDFAAGDLAVGFEAQEVRLRGAAVALTPAEYRLLYHLVRNAGRVLPHQVLLERVWGAEWGATTNNLKALVSRLRAKLEVDGQRFIENERGLGYRFVRPVERPAAAVTA